MTLGPKRLTKPSWSCVHFAADAPRPGELHDEGLFVAEIDTHDVHKEPEMLAALAREFRFPDYFGGNWDAVDECLRDLGEWLGGKAGYVLIVRRSEHLWQDHPHLAAKVQEVWVGAAQHWGERDTPFHLVFEW